ncbi:MAG: T9SS type A sorting domain-containing protein [Flavipsychrobacter sp.]|nr:T9SS type A sorting domain-containing protein [Flavipsychrobacter sp.]
MKNKKLLINVFIGFCTAAFITTNAQSTLPILTLTGSNGCTGGTFTATSSLPPAYITWKKNNNTVKVNYAGYGGNAATVAGDIAGNGGVANNQLDNPFGLFVDNEGNTYVADQLNNRIQEWAPGATIGKTVAGSPIGTAGIEDSLLYAPTGVYVDNNGYIYIADFGNSRIQKWKMGATTGYTVAGSAAGISGSADSLLDFPIAVFIDGSGNLFVSDYDNNRVQKFASGATKGITVAGGTAGAQLANPSGLFVDNNNDLYVADNGNNRILKFTALAPAGVTVAGDSNKIFGSDSTHLLAPDAIYVDGAGNIYIADVGNNRIQRWAKGATSGTTIVGSGLLKPQGIFLDNAGELYVADAGNERIQKFANGLNMSFTGDGPGNYTATVTTFAGVSKTISGGTSWTGAAGNDWNTAANWCSNAVPGANDDIYIPSTLNKPELISDTAAVHSIVTDSAADLLIDSALLKVSGMATLNGNVTGTGWLLLNGTDTQKIAGKDTIANLELNNANGAYISTADTINIRNAYNPSQGILNVHGGLVLLSDSNATAAIASGNGNYINGQVTVQQYIHGGRRAFRFLGNPFSESIALSQLTNTIDITGDSGKVNGFTTTETNNPSAFWYDPTTGNGNDTDDNTGWKPIHAIADSGVNAWQPMEGMRVMVRGAKGEGLHGEDYVPSATTLVLNGHINQGTKTVKLIPNDNVGYNFISNPYAAPIDLSTLVRGDSVGPNFWVWDPNQQTQGAYISLPFDSSYILPAYSSFVVTVRDSIHNAITFTESNKVGAAVSGNLFKTTKKTGLGDNMVQLHILSAGGHTSWDRVMLYFNNQASGGIDNLDAHKLYNPDLNFYTFGTDNTKMSIDVRPYVDGQIIKLGLTAGVQGIYTIRADNFTAPAGAQFFLHDKYLNEVHAVYQGFEYTFQVTGDASSQGDNRFELSLNDHATPSGTLHVYVVPNPASDVAIVTYENVNAVSTTLRITNMLGQEVYTQQLGQQQNGDVTIPVKHLPAGIYLVSLQSGNKIITQQLVKR